MLGAFAVLYSTVFAGSGGIAQASMLPIIAISTIYLRYRHVPKAVLPKGWITFALWVTTAIIVVMMSYSLIIRHLL